MISIVGCFDQHSVQRIKIHLRLEKSGVISMKIERVRIAVHICSTNNIIIRCSHDQI